LGKGDATPPPGRPDVYWRGDSAHTVAAFGPPGEKLPGEVLF
jgi:hypothetical protein